MLCKWFAFGSSVQTVQQQFSIQQFKVDESKAAKIERANKRTWATPEAAS